MRKKLTLMFVALMAIAAFAATQVARRGAATALIDFPNSSAGITANGTTTTGTVEGYQVFTLKNSYTGDNVGKNIGLSVEGGFKKGDIVTVAGFIKNSDETKSGAPVLFTADAVDGEPTTIYTFENFPNLSKEGTITEQSYTLEQDYAALYLGRKGNTGTNLTVIKVERPAKLLYIAGLSDVWDISNMTEIPYNEETKSYVYEADIEKANVYFAISDVASSSSWDDFNGSHRYAVVKGQDYTPAIGEEVQLIKTEGEGAIGVPGTGKYKFTITEDMKMTITEMAPDKLYIIGDVNSWNNTALAEMTFNETTQTFEYTIETEGQSNFSISTVPSFNNWDEDFKGKFRYAIGEGNNIPAFGEEIQLTKCVEGNITLDKAGKYLISVNKDMKITVKSYEDIVIDNPSGDLAAAIAAAEKGKVAKNITINLAAGAQYTLSESITISSDLTINGNGAIIDASTLETPMVSGNATAPTIWEEANVNISDLTIKGLNKALFYSAAKNTLYKSFIIDNCAIEVAADATTFDFTKGSVAENFTMTNSTVYAPTATTKQFYSSQSGQKATEARDNIVQTFTFKNNTMYNLAKSKNFFSHRQSNQKWLAYDVENNIFVNCGKSGQVIKGMNGGQGGANPTWTISGNIFNYDGADTSAAEETGDADEPVKNSVAGVVEFTDAANGDFNGLYVQSEGAEIPVSMPGDPRWTIKVKPVEINTDIAANADIAEVIAAQAAGRPISSITLNLAADAAYTLSAPIAATGDIVINGNGATIDASVVNGALISYPAPAAGAPAMHRALTEKDAYTYVDNIIIKDVTITGIKGSIFYENCAGGNAKKLAVKNFTIDNAVLGLATEAVSYESLIAFNGGGVKDFTIQNSTVYNTTNTFAKYFLRYNGNNGRIDNMGWNKTEDTQSWNYLNNTFYKVIASNGQWGNGPNGQNYFIYNVKNNIWVECSNQIIRRLGNGRIATKTEYKNFDKNTYILNGKDNSASEASSSYDDSNTILPTDPEFADAANGDFHVGAGTAQAKEQTGDPRWLVAYDATKMPAKDIEIAANKITDGDITAAIAAAYNSEYQKVGSVKLNLAAGDYTVSAPILTSANVNIQGNGATIDASGLTDGFIKLASSPSVAANTDGVYELDNITIENVKINNLETNLINGQNGVKYLYKEIKVNNSIVAIDGSKNKAIFFFQGLSGNRSGGAEQLTVSNSTLYAYPALEQAGGLFDNQSGSGVIQDLKGTKQVLTIENSTLYNISKGKNTCSQARNNQDGAAFEVKNSIIVNCGKDKQFLKGLGGGGWRNNVAYTVDNSSFTFGADKADKGTDGAADEIAGAPAKATFTNIVYGVPFFRKLTNSESWFTGDFTLGICPQIGKKVGDPRWYNIPMITNLENALAQAAQLLDGAQEDWATAPAMNGAVENLAAAYNDNKPYLYSNSQEEIDEATARVEAAIAAFNKEMGDVTAIESVNAATIDGGAWYTINGQRVDKPAQKGLYIHNGRKVVIK